MLRIEFNSIKAGMTVWHRGSYHKVSSVSLWHNRVFAVDFDNGYRLKEGDDFLHDIMLFAFFCRCGNLVGYEPDDDMVQCQSCGIIQCLDCEYSTDNEDELACPLCHPQDDNSHHYGELW